MLSLFNPAIGLVSQILTSTNSRRQEQTKKGSNFLTKACVSAPSVHASSMPSGTNINNKHLCDGNNISGYSKPPSDKTMDPFAVLLQENQ
jgi:hypothetical protein